MRRTLLITCLALLAACSRSEPRGEIQADTVPADSITRRQRDSVLGASRLPGASGIRGALEASDAAADRAALIDSLSGGH